MPKPKKGARLASGPTHQHHLMRGLAASLIIEERIRTSEAKAKFLRPYAEKLVTLGKTDTLHARRLVLKEIEDFDVVHKLFSDIGPRFAERNGGYTRILKLGPRKGDAAPMAIIEFVEGEAEVKAAEEESAKRRGLRRRKKEDEVEEKPAKAASKAKPKEDAEEKAAPAKPKAKAKTDDAPAAKSEPAPKEAEAAPTEAAPTEAE